jgi:hypothetical protein
MSELDVLVGEWDATMTFPPESGLGTMHGFTKFEWILGGAFLLQTSGADDPVMPSGHSLIAGGVQHYFDSRGVVRRYDMMLADGVWTLSREPDPPEFHQRFRATIEGDTMTGVFERVEDGEWIHDFDIVYARRG